MVPRGVDTGVYTVYCQVTGTGIGRLGGAGLMDTRDVWMELTSRPALVAFMDWRGMSVRALAARAVVRDPRTGRRRALSHQVVGHLRSGHRRTCTPATARAVEQALDVPPGSLFVPRTVDHAA